MAKSSKFYVVWEGHNPGIYMSWATCQTQIKNYPNARYKSFKTRKEAEDAYANGSGDYWGKSNKSKKSSRPTVPFNIPKNTISVDAACSGNPGLMEYRGVLTDDGTELFRMGPYHQGTNNVGEFLALVHALALLKNQGDETRPIFSDSKIAILWVKNKKSKSKLKQTSKNGILFEYIARAENWLNTNTYKNPILKWETRSWGEIPADFGRK